MSTKASNNTPLKLGFIPLLDCAPLVIAREKGFFDAEGLEVVLSRESSWANIRDKVSFGLLDGAQMLSPMPLASTLGLGTPETPMVCGLALSMNGNAITLSASLYQQLSHRLRKHPNAAEVGSALKQWITAQDTKPVLATVFPYSCQHYQLRYWLSACGINPDKEVSLIAVPPAEMVGTLQAGRIDGYCAGEPWNTLAQQCGAGRIALTGYQVWSDATEKVFAVTRRWAEQHPETHLALIRALARACHWLDQPDNHTETLRLLSLPPYLDRNAIPLNSAAPGLPIHQRFSGASVNAPTLSHALLLLDQMERWGQWHGDNHEQVAGAVYRSDLYRAALAHPAAATQGNIRYASESEYHLSLTASGEYPA